MLSVGKSTPAVVPSIVTPDSRISKHVDKGIQAGEILFGDGRPLGGKLSEQANVFKSSQQGYFLKEKVSSDTCESSFDQCVPREISQAAFVLHEVFYQHYLKAYLKAIRAFQYPSSLCSSS